MESSFETFLLENKHYCDAYRLLSENSRLLATSARLVYELHKEQLGPVANSILSFVHSSYGPDYIDRYILRLSQLSELQKRFDASPGLDTLGSPHPVDNDSYCLTLLLSIVLTNHRFEIMDALLQFLRSLPPTNGSGRVASIGAGTGYELKLIGEAVANWDIEAYDTDENMRIKAQQLLSFFQVPKIVEFGSIFPLERPHRAYVESYDAIVLCEVLEHLRDPVGALNTLRECLRNTGRMFVTMAINIAQEDHVFLYPDVNSCRRQLQQCGLRVEQEWL